MEKGDLLQWSMKDKDRWQSRSQGLAVFGESSSPAGLAGSAAGAMVSAAFSSKVCPA